MNNNKQTTMKENMKIENKKYSFIVNNPSSSKYKTPTSNEVTNGDPKECMIIPNISEIK
jgi:hypothetical protein